LESLEVQQVFRVVLVTVAPHKDFRVRRRDPSVEADLAVHRHGPAVLVADDDLSAFYLGLRLRVAVLQANQNGPSRLHADRDEDRSHHYR
jgi:hypothetical protein